MHTFIRFSSVRLVEGLPAQLSSSTSSRSFSNLLCHMKTIVRDMDCSSWASWTVRKVSVSVFSCFTQNFTDSNDAIFSTQSAFDGGHWHALTSRRQPTLILSVSWHPPLPHPVGCRGMRMNLYFGSNQSWNFVNALCILRLVVISNIREFAITKYISRFFTLHVWWLKLFREQ